MPLSYLDLSFGPASRNLLAEATNPGREGALTALESFYYALNSRDLDALTQVWHNYDLVQLNNPLGGILRGRGAIVELYQRVFDSPARLEVTFGDIVEYLGPNHAVFAGRETGTFTAPDGTRVPLSIRTTRYFGHLEGRWGQLHHHGSIDDADALRAYQRAINSGT
ncbi:MAG TPA: nuclear transport factor 2 family protein [Pseudonocardiaceae bacterium]|jgi:hypothetical protein